MNSYRGLFADWFVNVEAESEADAQNKMREALIAYLNANREPFVLWERDVQSETSSHD